MASKKQAGPPPAIERSSYYDDNYLVETVYLRRPEYAVLNGNNKGVQIVENLKLDSVVTIKPYGDPKRNIESGSILLPQRPIPYKSKAHLLEVIQRLIHDFADMPPFWEQLAAYYALMTWVFDLFGAVPYLRFLGDYECGKTRMQDCVAHCSYKTVVFSGSSTLSPMFRMIEMYKGTLSIDEADFSNSDLDSEMVKMLNVGYRRGGSVWRSDREGDNYQPSAYNVYSPKILTNRRRFKDEATESRCLTYIVPKDKPIRPDIPVQLVPPPTNSKTVDKNSFSSRTQQIRNMCLQWRFDNYRKLVPDLNVPTSMPNRYREVSVPLLTLIESGDFRDEFIEFLSGEGKTSKQESEMALCVQALRFVTSSQINGRIRPGEIAVSMTELAKENGEELKISGKAVGDMLRQLGFEPAPRSGQGRHFHYTRTQIDNLVKQFHL